MAQNEPLLTLDPAPEAVGRDPFIGKSHVARRKIVTFRVPTAGNAAGNYNLVGFPKNSLVTSVRTVVREAFTAAVTLTLGDGTDLFLASLDIAPQTLNACAASDTGGEAAAKGKFLPSGGNLVLAVGVATALVGELLVDVEWVEADRYPSKDIA